MRRLLSTFYCSSQASKHGICSGENQPPSKGAKEAGWKSVLEPMRSEGVFGIVEAER